MKKGVICIGLVSLFSFCSCSGGASSINYKKEVTNVIKLMKNIPTIESTLKGEKNSKNSISLDKSLIKFLSDDDAYDYTEYIPPKNPAHALALIYDSITLDSFFSLDDRLESSLANNERIINRYAKQYNKWEDYEGKECRVSYNPSFKNLKIDVKEFWVESGTTVNCCYTYSIGKSNEDKIVFYFMSYMVYPISKGVYGYAMDEIHYLEDTSFSSLRINEYEKTKVIEYGEIDFAQKILHSYKDTSFASNKETFNDVSYYEIPYDTEIMPLIDYDLNQKQPNKLGMIYDKDYVPYYDSKGNTLSLYAFDGIESITSSSKITLNEDSERNPYVQGVPLTITTTTGKTINAGDINNAEFWAIAYNNPYGETDVIVPCLKINSNDIKSLLDNLKNNYGLTLKKDIAQYFDGDIGTANKEQIIEKYKELRNNSVNLYQPLGKDLWDYLVSNDNMQPVKPNEEYALIDTSIKGNMKYNDGEIDLSDIVLHMGKMNEYINEDYYIDYYLYNDSNRYIVGSEKIDYKGDPQDFQLNTQIKLEKPLYHIGDYSLVAVLRNRGKDINVIKAVSPLDERKGSFKYGVNDNGELTINVSYNA